ncbi:ribonuclease J [Fusobacterium sp. IOR10]|uniref:ribonuclease J n=1 Tax=Fusobacterium sp. IOR10 TaxID=2665157 RepID=UPI0013D319DC|nr:ribonuclease J [Fusobacterium sp. IOR10]
MIENKEEKINEKVLEKKNVKNKEEKMYIIPLGGLDEVGKNMTLVQYRDEIIIIDCGIGFPGEGLLGIDVVIPDFSYVENNKSKIKGLFVTHGHEDHIGAIPYLYQKIDKDVSIFSGKLTLALIEGKFESHRIKNIPKLREVKSRSKIKVGKYFDVEFVRITHSIADSYSIYVKTPAGKVLFTGDFKIDLTPVDNNKTDLARFAEIGEEGLDLLLSDSTNAETEGFTPSESTVGEAFKIEFPKAKGRIIIAAFASHIHRLQQIIEISEAYGRKIAIDGRSLIRTFDVASKLGYLKMKKDTMISLSDVDKQKDNKVVILCTGTQGEPRASLSRIASNIHKNTKVKEGDTVIISATPIPGNEKAVSKNINNLLKYDAEVIFKKVAGIHVSGHGSRLEQELMFNLVNPKHFMPVHGEYKMLKAHIETAIRTGIKKTDTVLALNGSKVEVTKSYVKLKGKVSAGATFIDGLGVGDIGQTVLRDRQQLSQDGVIIVVFTFDKKTGKIMSGPEIVTRGFTYSKDSEEIINGTIEHINKKLEKIEKTKIKDWQPIKNLTKEAVSKYVYNKTKRNPVILPIIMEV